MTEKYEGTAKPTGKDKWEYTIDVVKYDEADVEIDRYPVQSNVAFNGVRADCRQLVIDTVKRMAADRDAVLTAQGFVVTERDGA